MCTAQARARPVPQPTWASEDRTSSSGLCRPSRRAWPRSPPAGLVACSRGYLDSVVILPSARPGGAKSRLFP